MVVTICEAVVTRDTFNVTCYWN